MIDVSIIIVSYNAKEYLAKAIAAVVEDTKSLSTEIIVVENGSKDGSFEMVRRRFPKVKIVPVQDSVGFSAANNIGAKQAKGEVLLFLNPDTEVKPGAILSLLHTIKHTHGRALVSGQLLNEDGSIQPQGGSLPNLGSVLMWMLFIDDIPFINILMVPYQQRRTSFFEEEQDVGWIGGTVLMITAKAFQELGGWDGAIFLYGEDVEFCARARLAGYRCILNPQAKITHYQHKSGSSARSRIGEVEGLIYIWKKHHNAWELPILRCVLWIGAWLRVIVFGILLGDDDKRRTYLEIEKRARMA